MKIRSLWFLGQTVKKIKARKNRNRDKFNLRGRCNLLKTCCQKPFFKTLTTLKISPKSGKGHYKTKIKMMGLTKAEAAVRSTLHPVRPESRPSLIIERKWFKNRMMMLMLRPIRYLIKLKAWRVQNRLCLMWLHHNTWNRKMHLILIPSNQSIKVKRNMPSKI